MPIELGTQGQADFTQPIELLMDCHRRIERFIEILGRVVDRHANMPLDQQGREALETSLNYFKQAAPRHNADEEESLFPRMRQLQSDQAKEIMARIDMLEADHQRTNQAHATLDQIGRKWLDQNNINADELAQFKSILETLTRDYQAHIHMEDHEVFTAAAAMLDEDSLAKVGQEMRDRRRIDPGRPGSRCAQRRTQSLEES